MTTTISKPNMSSRYSVIMGWVMDNYKFLKVDECDNCKDSKALYAVPMVGSLCVHCACSSLTW